MMVDKKTENASPEEPSSKQTKKYVLVKNHIRELLPEYERLHSVANDNELSEKSHRIVNGNRKRKNESPEMLPSEPETSVICKNDLDELKTVYERCRAVVRKIESKYGHLLGLDNEECFRNDAINPSDRKTTDSCNCSVNRKIVFDENGRKIEKECTLENHICPKKIIKQTTLNSKPAVQVEYDNISDYLPNDLVDLENILKDPSIDMSYRNLVINKIYLIRQEHLHQIRYERNSLIEILKANPDELLDFKGTNVSSLPGYPTQPFNYSTKSKESRGWQS